MALSKRRPGKEQPPVENLPSARELALSLLAAMVFDDQQTAKKLLPESIDVAQAVTADLSLISAALLISWGRDIGLPPEELLADIAIGQALDATTR